MFVNPCFYFEELFPAVVPAEASGALDVAARQSDAPPVSPGENEETVAGGAACSQ